MGKLFLMILLFLAQAGSAQQNTGSIDGRILFPGSSERIGEVQLFLPMLKQLYGVDSNGRFIIAALPYGVHTIHILIDAEPLDSFTVSVDREYILLGDIALANPVLIRDTSLPAQADIPLLSLERPYTGDDGLRAEDNISIPLHSSGSRDPFINAATFTFGQYYFRPRGYDSRNRQVYINGLLMNDAATGTVQWGAWSGLNDVFKNQLLTYGSGLHEQAYGGLNGTFYFDAGACEQSKQDKFSYALSNKSYNNRIMFTHSSGVRKSGWAYTLSGSGRWAEEGYVPGTFMKAMSGFMSAGKVLDEKSSLSLTLIAAGTVRGRSGTATDEVYQLSGSPYYNANWGWQEGQKRNARVATLCQPIGIIRYQYNRDERLHINTAIGAQAGKNSISSLDWYNAIDPRSDYYRNLPSYYASSPAIAAALQKELSTHPDKLQLNWTRFYNVNRGNQETLYGVNGTGDSVSGNRSLYVVGADESYLRRIAWSSDLQYKYAKWITFSAGTQAVYQHTEYGRRLLDLLGGDYFLNENMFAVQQYPGSHILKQNDLNNPDRAVREGERYKYHYTGTVLKALLWAQADMDFKKISWYASINGGSVAYQRNGIYRNGLYAVSSAGKSPVHSFLVLGAKSGVTYKINGRNYFIFNAAFSCDEPDFDNVYVSPRLRNQVITTPSVQQARHAEAGYLLRAARTNLRLILYATEMTNGVNIQRFYNDEPEYQSFVNFVMTKINTRHTGLEFAVDYAVTKMVSVNAATAIGQSFYTGRPQVQVYNDNDTGLNAGANEVYIKNYYLGVGPQSVYTTGVAYNSKRYWYLRMNANYIDRNYIAVNPARRSVEAAEFLDPGDPVFTKIFDQEKLPAFFTIDASVGKSFRLGKIYKKISYQTMLYLNIGLNNILDKQDIKLMGFEQLRYDFTNNNPDKFPSKYSYALGRTFFASLSFKF